MKEYVKYSPIASRLAIKNLAYRLGIEPGTLSNEQIAERIWNRDVTCKTKNDAATAAAHAKTMTSVGT